NRYLPIVSHALKWLVVALALLGTLQAWDLGGFEWLGTAYGRAAAGRAAAIAVILVIAVVVWEVSSGLIDRQMRGDEPARYSPRVLTLLPLLRNVILVTELVIVALMVLSELDINIGPLLAGAGVIGLAIGFGSQALVKDIINGLFILFENMI